MKKLIHFVVMFCCCCFLHAQAPFPTFGSLETDGFTTLNRSNLGWTQSIVLTSIASRGITFDPSLTYNSFVWQKTNGQWIPVVNGDGGPTWGWTQRSGSIDATSDLTYNIRRFRCVANDQTNQWTYEYYGFKTSTLTFNLDIHLAERPDDYPECSDTGIPLSAYGVDSGGATTGYLLLLRGNGGPMPSLTTSNPSWTVNEAYNNTRPIVYSPGGIKVDLSGSTSDTNGNKTSEVSGANDVLYDSIGRPSLTIANSITNHLTTYSYPDTTGNLQNWTMQDAAYNVESKFGCNGVIDFPLSSVYLPNSLSLPGGNGSYSFQYESASDSSNPSAVTGRIAKITLPTGGYIQFTYSGVNCDDGSPMQMTKTINDGTTSQIWTYLRTYPNGVPTTTITTPTHSVVVSFTATGVPTDEKIYPVGAGASGTPLQEVATSYSGGGTSANDTPNFVTTTRDGISRMTQLAYDAFTNLTFRIDNYNSTNLNFVRSTHTTYISAPAYLSAGLVSLPSLQTISVAGNIVSRTEYYYDNLLADGTADSDSGNIAMVCRSGAAAHDDTAYGCSSTTPRGNLTKVVQYTNAGAQTGAIKTYYGYDSLGNLLTVKDGKGNSSTIDYTDNWYGTSSCSVGSAFAYPTSVTDALSHPATSWYNRCTGQAVKSQDQNLQVTTLAYSDPLLRPTSVTYPDNTTNTPSIQYAYPHTSGSANLSTQQSVLQSAGVVQLQTTVTDGLGRVTSVTTADPQGDDIVATHYDAEGRQYSVSNPYRSGATPSNTTYTYDALGRATILTYPDSTTKTASFSGNTVSYGGTAGSPRTVVYDALGNVSQVQEPNPAGGSALVTNYSADGNGNITQINQLGTGSDTARQRNFVYDSLGRLLSAAVPESGVTCYGHGDGTLAGCQNDGYDANGNLQYKTDARGITVNYSYDALNRLTNKYFSGSATVPGFNFTYGWDTVNPAVANGIGRLLYTLNGQGETEQYWYDAMGRVTSQSVYLLSAPHTAVNASAVYDLAGNMTDLTYPDGRHIQQSFDRAGRMQTSTLHDINGVAQSQSYLTSVAYNPDGSPNVTTLGNGVQQTIQENNRFQVASMSAASPFGSSTLQPMLSRTYCYVNCATGGTANKGNIWGITDNLNATRNQGFTYDNLNRISSFSLGGALNQQYAIDSFGNLSGVVTGHQTTTFDPTTNRIGNLPCATSAQPYDAAGNQTCDTDPVSSGVRTYTFDAESRVVKVAMQNSVTPYVTYSYGANGNRVRKLRADSTYTEYVSFGGQTIAEKDQTGAFTDYIFAGGNRIAKVNPVSTQIHFSGTNGAAGQAWAYHIPFGGYVIRQGDKIAWRQMQSGPAVPRGGVGIAFTDGSYTNWVTQDQNGQTMNALTTQNAWVYRVVDLSADAGKTVASSWISEDADSGAGNWDERFADISFTRADGTVVPIYNGQTSVSYASFGSSGVTNQTIAVEQVADGNQTNSTHFYLGDHLGTAQMEFAGEGWPVWQGQFAPFGGELDSQNTTNHYKFTGQERDDKETGQDHFLFRDYVSSTGRWTSPDPYLGSYDLSNPQSLNRYAYVQNNPLSYVDPFGLNLILCTTYTTKTYSSGYDGGMPYISVTEDDSWTECSGGGGGGGGGGEIQTGEYGGGGGEQGSGAAPSKAPSNCPAGPANVYSFIQANQPAANALAKTSGVNADYLLGLSGWESQWGANRFAQQGNNFFSLHGGSSAPFANGSMKAGGANVYLSTFPSYFASGQSFLAQYGNGLAGANSPAAFAQQLINNHFNSGNAATGGNSNFLSNTVTGINMVIRRKGC